MAKVLVVDDSLSVRKVVERALAGRLQQALELDFPRYLRRLCQGETLARN